MEKVTPTIGLTVSYFENNEPRQPRSEEESQYLDHLVNEYNKDQAYAGEFAQLVIYEAERFNREESEVFGNLNNATGKAIARRAKGLAADAQKLIRRIVECRSYQRQLVILATDLGMFLAMVEARSAIMSEMRLKRRNRPPAIDQKYEILRQVFKELWNAGERDLSTEAVNELLRKKKAKIRKRFASYPIPKGTLTAYRKMFREELKTASK